MSAPVQAEAEVARPRRARLGRYALWQLRDYAIGRGLPTFLIAAMFGALAIIPMLKGMGANFEHMPPRVMQRMIAQHGSVEGVRQYLLHDLSSGFLRGFVGTIVFLGALFATNALVSGDRKQGYYRFMFSKPLSPLRYYGQAMLLHLAAFALVVCALAGLYGFYVEPILTPAFVAVLSLIFVMYAGVGFLMTTLVRWDWLGLSVVAIAAQVLWEKFGTSTSMFAKLLYLLPPMHRTGEVYGALIAGTTIPWHALAWFGGYGAACVVAALAVLRTQRLALS